MPFPDMLLRAYRALRYAKITKSPGQLLRLSRHRDLHPGLLERGAGGGLVIPGTDVSVFGRDREFLLEGLALVDDLRRAGGRFTPASGGGAVIEVGGVRLMLKCWEELFIAHEVFHRGIYNLSRHRPFRVIDVGMNTGTAALFFAANPRCERVHAFELFPPTLARAQENVALNPHLADKVTIHGFGLGPRDERLELDYYPDRKGSLGVAGLPDYARPDDLGEPAARVGVELRAAAPVFARWLDEAEAPPLVCKLDCEGSEYGILQSLGQAGLLGRIDCFMIEWHLHGPAEIKELLGPSGFVCLSLEEHTGTHGMVYAFRALPA